MNYPRGEGREEENMKDGTKESFDEREPTTHHVGSQGCLLGSPSCLPKEGRIHDDTIDMEEQWHLHASQPLSTWHWL